MPHLSFFISLFALSACALSFTLITSAQSCHQITLPPQTPAGYASPVSYLSGDLMIKADCSGDSFSATIGNNKATTWIYDKAYLWNGSEWKTINVFGSDKNGVWIPKEGTTASLATQGTPTYFVAYTCEYINNQWKCGCQNQTCSQPQWQLQMLNASTGVSGQQGGGGGGGTAELPESTREVPVSSNSALQGAISNAQPGDHIILSNGTYSGFTVSRSGQSGKPIIIRAASSLGAKIAGSITFDGDHVWVVGVDITEGGRVSIQGSHNRISSSRLRPNGRGIRIGENAMNAVIDHNDLESQAKCDTRTWFGIILEPNKNGYNPHVYRNYFHDAVALCDGGDDNSVMHIGGNRSRSRHQVGMLFEYNLIENWKGDDEIISNKSSGNTYQFNTAIGGKEFVNRHGEGNKWIANWIEATGIRLHDGDHLVIGNVTPQIRAYAGNVAESAWEGSGSIPSAAYVHNHNTVFAGNKSTLLLGYNPKNNFNRESTDITVEAHDGAVTQDNVEKSSLNISNTTNRNIPQAFKLTRSEVGPNAPTAPKL